MFRALLQQCHALISVQARRDRDTCAGFKVEARHVAMSRPLDQRPHISTLLRSQAQARQFSLTTDAAGSALRRCRYDVIHAMRALFPREQREADPRDDWIEPVGWQEFGGSAALKMCEFVVGQDRYRFRLAIHAGNAVPQLRDKPI